jgi:hypothetical protein
MCRIVQTQAAHVALNGGVSSESLEPRPGGNMEIALLIAAGTAACVASLMIAFSFFIDQATFDPSPGEA